MPGTRRPRWTMFNRKDKLIKKVWKKQQFFQKKNKPERLSPEDVIANALHHEGRMRNVTAEDGLWILDVLKEFGYIVVSIEDEHSD